MSFRTKGRNSSATVRGLAKTEPASEGDLTGDGVPDIKVSENESPSPKSRNFIQKNKLAIGIVSLLLVAVGIYIAGASGGVWKNKTFTNVTVPTDSRDTTKTNTTTAPTTVKTCKDKETVATGYKLFYSDTYKYCFQYPSAWPVEQTKADMVTFGTVNPEPTPGWFKVTHFKDKSAATRTEEIMSNFREPAGPCTRSDLKVGAETAKKLDCIGSFDGEDHVYVLLGHGQDLFELSYIVGSDSTNTLSEAKPRATQIEAYLQSLLP